MKLPVVCAAVAAFVAIGATASEASTPAPIVFAATRAPTVTGEIYRIDPNGTRVDLSNSLAYDRSPAVSSDGKRVAFLSDRLGGTAVYEVGIDGTNLTLVARHIHDPGGDATIYWQPKGRALAIGNFGYGTPAIVRPSHRPVYVRARFGAFATGGSPWSPDGKVLELWTGTHLYVVNPRGRVLWTAPESYPYCTWSPTGLLAVSGGKGVAVYDEQGRRLFGIAHASDCAWSPNGRFLAVSERRSTVVVNARGVLVRTVPGTDAGPWVDNHRLVIRGVYYHRRCAFYDIRTRAVTSGACGNVFDAPRSARGKLAIVTPKSGRNFELGVAPLLGGRVTKYATVPGCASGNGGVEWNAAPAFLQFAGRTRSIVYENWDVELCYGPQAELYAVEPDGSGLTRVTHVVGAMAPRVSPDGTTIAYVSYFPDPGMCGQSIKTATLSGSPLTDVSDWDYFGTPAWSPDGTTLLDSGMSCGGDPHDSQFFTIPAGGGSPTYLKIRGTEAAWGPTRIAFVGGKGLTTADPDGTNRVVVAKDGQDPAWSPSGQLAYLVGTTLIVGSNPAVQLPFARIESLEWTADGTRLVFAGATTKNGSLDLYTAATDGTDIVRLTTNFDVLGDPGYPFP
jgi:Tol biopolymer transport system component